jgi:hypothetical protein
VRKPTWCKCSHHARVHYPMPSGEFGCLGVRSVPGEKDWRGAPKYERCTCTEFRQDTRSWWQRNIAGGGET